MTPRRIMRRRRERIHQRPPDPIEDADRPLEEPHAPPDRSPSETSDSDPYDDPRDREA